MEFAQLKFKILRLLFSLITSALIALIISTVSDMDWLLAFCFLALGLPIIVFAEKLKNIPAYLVSAYLVNKELVREAKKRLRKLPLKTAEEWNEFESFYDSDQSISEYASTDPKTFAVATRYTIQALRDCGHFMDFMNSGLVYSKAIEQIYWETAKKESD